MSVSKQVDFIEQVGKSLLGLEGLQIVVYSDRCRGGCNKENIIDEKYNFEEIGKRLLKEVDGEYIKQKYEIEEHETEEFLEKLHQERINWIKNKMKIS